MWRQSAVVSSAQGLPHPLKNARKIQEGSSDVKLAFIVHQQRQLLDLRPIHLGHVGMQERHWRLGRRELSVQLGLALLKRVHLDLQFGPVKPSRMALLTWSISRCTRARSRRALDVDPIPAGLVEPRQ
jgi:hypothetical protein